jgi:hypothetical protein
MDRKESKRLSGGRKVGEKNQKREGNERVAWTTVVGVCFIDHTW